MDPEMLSKPAKVAITVVNWIWLVAAGLLGAWCIFIGTEALFESIGNRIKSRSKKSGKNVPFGGSRDNNPLTMPDQRVAS